MAGKFEELIAKKVKEKFKLQKEEIEYYFSASRKFTLDIINMRASLIKRMESIEKMVIAHSIGVQNVYEKFNKILQELEVKKEKDEEFRFEILKFLRKEKRYKI